MDTTIVCTVIGIAFSGFFSWFFTRRYYLRSLRGQEREATSQIAALMSVAGSIQKLDQDLIMQKHLEEAIEEYRRSGSPVRAIDSYDDLTREEKATLYDKVCLRTKGRPGKSNPYRGY